MMQRLRTLLLTPLILAATAAAQQPAPMPAQFLGFAYVQGTSTPIAGATVAFETLGLTTTTDADGRFRLTGIRPGNQIVTIKKIGFVALKSMMAFRSDDSVDTDLMLVRTQAAQSLAAVKVEERSMREWKIQEFEDRRKLGFGQFITRELIDKNEGRLLTDLLAMISGPKILNGDSGHAWAFSGGGATSFRNNGPVLDTLDRLMRASNGLCYTAVYVDGVAAYTGAYRERLFDLNTVRPESLVGVEYYRSGLEPIQYAAMRNACGLLLLWTR
jgi:hypothetical protein